MSCCRVNARGLRIVLDVDVKLAARLRRKEDAGKMCKEESQEQLEGTEDVDMNTQLEERRVACPKEAHWRQAGQPTRASLKAPARKSGPEPMNFTSTRKTQGSLQDAR